ncbi:NAD-dependent epimerase/dehydratase family protein [Tahibacter amnicola]|uniref:NAD-dependent epimerase/dehydratase family protein n=1 Tax=Tahibacter amnicola TaxID=2976241 RepID=A0ABY6BEN8_9GAMM|nr:NAD-dependent epimerase/dehydratase family protein [Tahibacter amnicola]UXI67723.1 NAD-dependent epimerase/dehydratase family protein [Tahibacter amnicola]
MGKKILVIGGTRYFGRRLVLQLLGAGHRVTVATRGLAPDAFGTRVSRIRVDRRDAAAMRRAFAGAGDLDVVFDQMCYSPRDAAVAADLFAGRVGRYVMASTIEVYRDLYGRQQTPFKESDLDLDNVAVDTGAPWDDPAWADDHYGLGKRMAEAVFTRQPQLPFVSARIAHVLGADDFTGRLAYYVELAREGRALRHSCPASPTSFIDADDIAAFLAWSGDRDFLGPVNVTAGAMSAEQLFARIARVLGATGHRLPCPADEPGRWSPFDYAQSYVMDGSRAMALGYRFDSGFECLDDLVRQSIAASGAAIQEEVLQ